MHFGTPPDHAPAGHGFAMTAWIPYRPLPKEMNGNRHSPASSPGAAADSWLKGKWTGGFLRRGKRFLFPSMDAIRGRIYGNSALHYFRKTKQEGGVCLAERFLMRIQRLNAIPLLRIRLLVCLCIVSRMKKRRTVSLVSQQRFFPFLSGCPAGLSGMRCHA